MDQSPAWNEVAGEVKILIRRYGSSRVGTLSNSEFASAVDFWSRGCGVSSHSERETTQTRIKVPKYWLSVKEGSLES